MYCPRPWAVVEPGRVFCSWLSIIERNGNVKLPALYGPSGEKLTPSRLSMSVHAERVDMMSILLKSQGRDDTMPMVQLDIPGVSAWCADVNNSSNWPMEAVV
jgi:hypothetical protein